MDMAKSLCVILFLLISFTDGQAQQTISVIDFVKIRNNKQKEVLFYYENNWKVYREIAVKKGYIKSFRLLKTTSDTLANFDLILMTEYADSAQLKFSEERFQGIIKEVRPDGPKLLNDLRANDIRQSVFLKWAETLFSSDDGK
jgi:hypothetical protein